jgi:PAS domain S-box-containing protein
MLFASGKKTVEGERVFANVGVDEQRDFAMELAKRGKGGKRYGDEIADAANIENDLIGTLFEQAAAEESDHRKEVLRRGVRVSMNPELAVTIGVFHPYATITERGWKVLSRIDRAALRTVTTSCGSESTVLYLRHMKAKAEQEDSLQKSEERFRLAAQAGKMYAYEWDVATDVITRSGNVSGSIGEASLTRQQLLTKVHPDDRAKFDASITERTPENPDVQISYRLLRPDGSIDWVEKTAHAFFDHEGRMVRMIGMVADITERKRAENALRESEMRYRRIVETTNEGVWVLDSSLCTSYVNRQLGEMLGYEPGEMGGRSVFDFYFPEDVEDKGKALNRRRQGVREQTEERLRRKDGSEVWVRIAGTPVFGSDGEFDGAFAMVSDITARKRAEQALRISEERLRSAQWAARIGTFEWNIRTGVSTRTPELEALYGVPPGSFGKTHEAFVNLVHPDDRVGVIKLVERSLEVGQPTEAEWRVVWPDGSVHWIAARWQVLTDESGEPSRIVGVNIDVTERKLAEEAIKESEQRFRLVADSAPVMIWMSGLDKRPTYFNRLWLEFTGQSETDLQNNLAAIVHPEDYEKCHEIYCRGFDQRQPFTKECRLRRYDGQYRWMLDVGVPRFHEDGSFAGYIGSCVDITEQKLAEAALSSIGGRLIEAHEQERTWIARELHDDISQRLALVAVDLDREWQNFEASTERTRPVVKEATKRISDVISDVHALSHRLHSSKLDILGLAAAAGGFCREVSERQNVVVDFQSKAIPKTLPKDVSLCLFRVLQEAVQNATKHSGSTHFQVALVGSSSQIMLTVRDEGRGFCTQEALQKRGLGLTSMMERLKLVGGKLSISAEPQSGTMIRACVPISPHVKSASAIA